ncbi:hypothetical protein ACFWUU_22585 [Kribbella sp. NPDC058693]|uniref:hypothetical protein n=1 Tax=Kribbella sp. NPDC058693 TaxID=3346602 RepID=UPI003654B08B
MTDVVEISPQSWEYRLVAAVVYAVEQRAGGRGGPRTRWNGRVLEETDPEKQGEGSRPRGQQATRPTGGPRQPHSPQRD